MIKDIVNRDLISLTNCESEPIHIPGSIQPHGFVLVLSRKDFKIVFCSANTESFIGTGPDELLDKVLGEAFPDAIVAFEKYINEFIPGTTYPHVFEAAGVSYNTTVSETEDYYLLELEPFPDG